MRTFTKYLLFCGAAFALWACSNPDDELENLQLGVSSSGYESSSSGIGAPHCKVAVAKQQGFDKEPDYIKNYEGYKNIDELDPSCKSEERKFFFVHDTNTINPPDLDKRIYECQEGETFEEAINCKDEAMIYWDEWRDEHKKRDLPIPCVVYGGAVNWWGAWLTDGEVAELEGTYGVWMEGQPEYSSGSNAVPMVVPDYIKESEGYKNLEPSCKSEQNKLVHIFDLSSVDENVNWDYVYSHLPGYVSGSGIVPEQGGYSQGKASYNVNGIAMTQEEYDVYKAEYWRKLYEERERTKRILDIPCSIGSGIALLSDKDIKELKEKYDYLVIEDYMEAVPDIVPPGGNGGDAVGGGYDYEGGCGGK